MFRCWLAAVLLAACWGTGTAQAQTNRQPWQGTFVKTSHSGDMSRPAVELPSPPAGKLLTIERIGITLGPTASVYGKLLSCEIESSHPRVMKAEYAADRVRVLLPLPAYLGQGNKKYIIIDTPTLVYADSHPDATLRVVCDADALFTSVKLTVTASGYTTDKQ